MIRIDLTPEETSTLATIRRSRRSPSMTWCATEERQDVRIVRRLSHQTLRRYGRKWPIR
jgi:hypothetical protein